MCCHVASIRSWVTKTKYQRRDKKQIVGLRGLRRTFFFQSGIRPFFAYGSLPYDFERKDRGTEHSSKSGLTEVIRNFLV